MTDTETKPITPAPLDEPKASANAIALSIGEHGSALTPANLGEVMRFAEVMARSDIGVPKHLRGKVGACTAICLQAMQWGFSPFAVANKSYFVNDLIAYEGQLIAAVLNTRAGLKQRPKITFAGSGATRKCIVKVQCSDGSEHEYESPEIGTIKPQNSPLWKTDPDQQLSYYSIRACARRHFPEVILGVYDKEEAEAITLPASDVQDITDKLRQRAAQSTDQEEK